METAHHASETGLRRQLSGTQMAMVAVGGSIGTGLLLGSGEAIHIAGPAVIISYLLGGAIMWAVTMACGELAAAHPAAGSFGVYAELYLNPWAGFVSRYGYWVAMVTSVGAEMIAAALYAGRWFPHFPFVGWIAVFGALLLGANLLRVHDYGTFEAWFAMIKVVTIVAFIVIGAALLFTGRAPAHFTSHRGFFPNGFLAPLLVTSFAIFTFGGVEMVAISSGEARTAAEVPRATRIMFAMLAFVYLGAMIVLVGVLPWDTAGGAANGSPFVQVFSQAGLAAASGVMNFVVLTAALSGANASLYSAARMLFSLSRGGFAPATVGRLNQAGSPAIALLVSCVGIVIAMLMAYLYPQTAFLFMLGAALFGGIVAWMVALAAHISFRRRASAETISRLPMRAPGGALTSAIAFVAMGIATIATWWTSLRITITSGPILLAILTIAYFAYRKRQNRMSA